MISIAFFVFSSVFCASDLSTSPIFDSSGCSLLLSVCAPFLWFSGISSASIMFCSCSFAPVAAGISTEFCPHVSSSGVTLVMSKTILPPASLLLASSVLSPSLSMGSPDCCCQPPLCFHLAFLWDLQLCCRVQSQLWVAQSCPVTIDPIPQVH